MAPEPDFEPEPARGPDRYGPWLVAIGSLLSLLFMAHHPSAGGSSLAEAVAEMSREAGIAAGVHGGLIVIMSAVFLGFLGLSEHLGLHLARVRGASLAYGLGVGFMVFAAMVSGFFVPRLASRYGGAPAGELEALRPVLRLGFEMNQSLAGAGTVAFSAAILLWSWVLLGREGTSRVVGVLGFVVGAVPAGALLGGQLHLDVHGMGAVMLAQAIWSVAVAIWWMRSRRSDRAGN